VTFRPIRGALLIIACALAVVSGCGSRSASPSAESVAPTSAAAAVSPSPTPFDHALFDEILRAHVEKGFVDYAGIKAQDLKKLRSYLDGLAAADPERFAGRDDELAFWLNAYNAFVIAGVLERYPDIASVMDVPGFFTDKAWGAAGQLRSLNEIENEIIRPRFEDPRIHFILVCAGRSCPPLQDAAMQAATLQSDLGRATREALNNTTYVQVDAQAKRLRLTRIMSWYKQDFVASDGSLEAFLARYLAEPAKSRIAAGGLSVEFMDYDWSLNDSAR